MALRPTGCVLTWSWWGVGTEGQVLGAAPGSGTKAACRARDTCGFCTGRVNIGFCCPVARGVLSLPLILVADELTSTHLT